MPAGATEPTDEALTRLRGAGAPSIDVRRIGRVLVALVLVGLTTLVVILFVAGAHRNGQINRLHAQGVPVQIRITGCLGLLGGSGSNAAGYTCRGTITLDGRRYTEGIPGDTLHPPGTVLRGVAVPGDPALVETARALAGEHASGRVFILPSVLLAVLVLSVAALLLRRRRPPSGGAGDPG